MKNLFVTFLGMVIAQYCVAQNNYSNTFNGRADVVYLELGGPGVLSLNYDARFKKVNNGWGYRVGLGAFGGYNFLSSTTVISFPIGVNYIVSKDKRNYFETGAGFTFLSISSTSNFMELNTTNETSAFGHLNIGYRFQPRRHGLFFRAALNPIFNTASFQPLYGGLAIGYKF